MSYGLDYSEVRFETDHAGNRLKATIPYTMFSALTEFWIAARRAQTARVEAGSRPGQYKPSLPTIPSAEDAAAPVDTSPAHPTDRHWRNLLAAMPEEPAAAAPLSEPDASSEQVSTPESKARGRQFFYREFVDAPPAEVMERINCGIYFTRAWREYRRLTIEDAAELYGKSRATIEWHESGKSAPSRNTLERLATIYDCPLSQITPKPGSDTSLFKQSPVAPRAVTAEALEAETPHKHRTISEPRSPSTTEYPEGVMTHLTSGKSPMLSWRLYRHLTVKALAEQYGTTGSNIKAMEENGWLRPKTIGKLAAIFHCKPEQLLRPIGLVIKGEDAASVDEAEVVVVTPEVCAPKKSERMSAPPSMETAFMEARVSDGRETKPRDSARRQRLARMQQELAGL